MVDKFSVDMGHTIADPSTVWTVLRSVTKAITELHLNLGRWSSAPWRLRADNRKWDRASVDELRKIAKEQALTQFSVHWDHAVDGMQWSVLARIYDKYPSRLEVDVYAGRDRMTTEKAAKAISDAMKRRGVILEMKETAIDSVDDGSPTPDDPGEPTPLRKGRWGWLGWIGRGIAAHIPQVIVGVVIGVLVLALGLWLGLTPAAAPLPSPTP